MVGIERPGSWSDSRRKFQSIEEAGLGDRYGRMFNEGRRSSLKPEGSGRTRIGEESDTSNHCGKRTTGTSKAGYRVNK